MSATEEYIERLECLKPGELGLLRTHAGQRLDESVEGFDLFTGLWWPLREKSQKAPRREVAWMIAKLYAFRPIPCRADLTLARQLRTCEPKDAKDDRAKQRFREKFDELLTLPLGSMEPPLRWALDELRLLKSVGVDWVKLTDDLSIWERESTRLRWAEQFLRTDEKGEDHAD